MSNWNLVTDDFTPNWGPLLKVMPVAQVEQYMWMYAAKQEDGTRIDAYKHQVGRDYVFLDGQTNRYSYRSGEYWRE